MDKDSRQNDIKKIISGQKIAGQEELLELLKKQGYDLTQATLSRDIRDLGIAKMPDSEKGYIYVLPHKLGIADRKAVPVNIPGDSILSVEFSYQFAIIKTFPGFASSVAIYIDSMNKDQIAGTVAGDDTILVIPREPFEKSDLKQALQDIFPKSSI